MTTKLITSDEQLRRYLPNAFATVKGETPFFDRVLPWLQTAEQWRFSQFVGDVFGTTSRKISLKSKLFKKFCLSLQSKN